MVKVHINRHIIAANARTGAADPPITIIRGRRRERGHTVELIGGSRIVYRPDSPLKCGARLWIEAEDAAVMDAEMTGTPGIRDH